MGIMEKLRSLAKEMIELQNKIDEIKKPLDEKKDIFRTLAEGKTLDITVEGFGKVAISKPREESTKQIVEIIQEKVEKHPELRALMLSKGIIKEIIQRTPAAKASITIKSNA